MRKIDKKQAIQIAIAIAIVLMIGVFLYVKLKKNKNYPYRPTSQLDTTGIQAAKVAVVACNDDFPLKKGSCGERVQKLQYWLQNVQRESVGVHGIDGKFGKDTEAALQNIKNRKNVSQEVWNKWGLDTINLNN